MRRIALERWDDGRVLVNQEFTETLRRHGLTTFNAVMNLCGEDVKSVTGLRSTTRINLHEPAGDVAFFVKRHWPAPWKEYIKPLLRLSWPVLGAHNEWRAILRCHYLGIPTMEPVALGCSSGQSVLVTRAIEGCDKLSHWTAARLTGPVGVKRQELAAIVRSVAHLARSLHQARIHHQDFYLCHLLMPRGTDALDIHVIDLGRARGRRHLGKRWIVKDLAQLNYSARGLQPRDRLRFLRHYLQRRLSRADRTLIRRILRKSAAIEQHTSRHAAELTGKAAA